MAWDSIKASASVKSEVAGASEDKVTSIEGISSESPGQKRGESFERLSEQSPLLFAQDLEDNFTLPNSDLDTGSTLEWHDGEAPESKSTWYLFILTLSIGG